MKMHMMRMPSTSTPEPILNPVSALNSRFGSLNAIVSDQDCFPRPLVELKGFVFSRDNMKTHCTRKQRCQGGKRET